MTPSPNIITDLRRKGSIAPETHEAICRAIQIWDDDRKVASYAAAPHEGITAEIVATIRRKMIVQGRLNARHYSMRRAG